jgi:uncharacterized membrane protein
MPVTPVSGRFVRGAAGDDGDILGQNAPSTHAECCMETGAPLPVEGHHVQQRHLDRLVMLSDGIFAIAITLSAIEIRPELKPGQSLWQAWSGPLTIYFLSFLLIGVIWIGHRRIVSHLRDIDGIGTAINLLLLSLVALMPVVIRFALDDASQDLGFVVYAVAIAVTFACMAALWFHVAFVARLAPDLELQLARIWLLEMTAAPLIIGAMAFYQSHLRPVALVLALAAVALWVGKGWMEYRRKHDR